MDFFQQLNKPTKILLGATLFLLLYGYLCRWIGIYFFWESLHLGWVLFSICLVVLFVKFITPWVQERNRNLVRNLAIAVVIMAVSLSVVIPITFQKSDAFVAAKTALKKDKSITNEIGSVSNIGLPMSGAMQTSQTREGVSGSAQFHIIVKGNRGYRDIDVYLHKEKGEEKWQVSKIVIDHL